MHIRVGYHDRLIHAENHADDHQLRRLTGALDAATFQLLDHPNAILHSVLHLPDPAHCH